MTMPSNGGGSGGGAGGARDTGGGVGNPSSNEASSYHPSGSTNATITNPNANANSNSNTTPMYYLPPSSPYYSTNKSSTAVFYTSILYTKPKSVHDAYLYAKALCYNDEYRRAISILDYAGLLDFNSFALSSSSSSSLGSVGGTNFWN
mmetsp:Transcript_25040/g.31539  ORF Transcript_25040/g.31539 Transcript_25040/m.31539 type:complete len:148 (-) Transcript_25040:108-551(-)